MTIWRRIGELHEGLRTEDRPVGPVRSQDALAAELKERFTFESPLALDALLEDVAKLLDEGLTHVTHPRYFGLFNPAVRESAAIGEALAAVFNPQMAVRAHAPAVAAIEAHTLAYFRRALGLPDGSHATFTAGGNEANFSAVLCALAHRFPGAFEDGVASLREKPVIYASADAHGSIVKSARMAGLGAASVRACSVDASFRLDAQALAAQLQRDVADGFTPLLVVGTAGATATGAIDPLPQLADLAQQHGAWFHVDAAWGGAAVLSPTLKPYVAGIERADSVTWDAHKWLAVPLAAGMFFCRFPEAARRAFGVAAAYMPSTLNDEPYATTAQWSRRALGLKVFMSLCELSGPGFAQLVDEMTRTGAYLKERLAAAGFRVLNDTPLPIANFQAPPGLLERVLQRNRVWISKIAHPDGALRACISGFRTTRVEVDELIDELKERPPRRTKRLALLTSDLFPDLLADDRLLVEALARRGIRAEEVRWDSRVAKLGSYDALLVRETWDYFLRSDEFRAFLDRAPVPVWNPPEVIHWNSHKRYLRELADKGLTVIPTRDAADEWPWDEVVIKPAVSAGAFQTFRLKRGDPTIPEKLAAVRAVPGGALVQPFVREIVDEGEWSLLFFDGELSHAVLKTPKKGDFRVQFQYGATTRAVTPTRQVVEDARSFLAAAPAPPLYARVDGAVVNGRLWLMELELIEPFLFLGVSNGGADRFAEAIARRL